ncbi:MAG: helix-turn-helix domain-containing protein [Synergistaceae bacterium]|nr:helix-turn-helix domain-containing protein [Synergistaceae bacterium]
MKTFRGFHCPLEASLQLIGGKYKALILWFLTEKTLRYSELHKMLPNVTDKMLTRQLRELEECGLVHREVYPVVPPKTEYSLTDFGRSLSPILKELCDWGTLYLADAERGQPSQKPEAPALASGDEKGCCF